MGEQALFQVRDVHYAYGGKAALNGIDFSLAQGRFYGLIGPNGSGKTTLLDLLLGEKEPSAGRVYYQGRSPHDFGRRALAREMALVPQDFQINFAFTVMEAVMMGRHPYLPRFGNPLREDYAIVEQAMADIGIAHFGDRPVTELSGGEKQRVVVARALAQQTPVLLLDEATSSLDVKYSLDILKAARRLVRYQGRTVIAVLHNLNQAAAFCDEIVMLREGTVYRAGLTPEVLTAEAIREVFEVESLVENNPYSGVPQVSYHYLD